MDKQLSKEEILKSIHKEKVINWEKVFKQNPTIIQSAYEAMDKWGAIKWKEAQADASSFNAKRIEEQRKKGIPNLEIVVPFGTYTPYKK